VLAALPAVGGGEVLIVDGLSTDGTRSIVADVAGGNDAVTLLDNPRRITPSAFNIGIRAARASLVAIVSGHCAIGPEFFRAAFERLELGEAEIVGGPIRAVPSDGSPVAWLLAQVVSHPFGVGNSRFRISQRAGYVDAVPFAVFRREVFEQVGLFDEELVRNQDTEFFGRCARAGIRVFLEPRMRSNYRARGAFAGLLSQGFRNAYWNVRVWRVNPGAFQWRHLIPGLFTTALLSASALAFVWPQAPLLLASGLSAHLLAGSVSAWQVMRSEHRALALLLPPCFLAYHFCYGLGTIAGLRHLVAPATPRGASGE
jgi:glycosyltransferase involved in cell wall biosynthesis